MDKPMQAQARLAMLIMPYHVPDFPCTLPRWLLPAAGLDDGLGLVNGLLLRLHPPDSEQRGREGWVRETCTYWTFRLFFDVHTS